MSTPKQPADLNESTDPTSEPHTLGRYQLLAKIASGGMASVFLARSVGAGGFEKLVAVKRIHPHLAEEKSFVDMFLDEARIASRIQHSNVCTVFDFGEADGTFYIAMEYLVGEPFARVLKAVAKSRKHYEDAKHPYLVARVIADACEGLHAAHELRGRDGELLNVVHRDISPQNLFLTYDGNVKVVDFGIASAADRVHHTEGGEVKGKFSYMAPEQAKGAKGGKLDRRADVFALGIVLWEMLTLKRLFRRDTPAETLYALISEDIPLPSTQRSTVPADLDPVVMKALARDPSQRYANTRELGRDLNRIIARSDDPVGMADLAEWMERLLPEERTNALRTVEAARSGNPADVQLVPALAGDVSSSDVVPMESSKVHPRTDPSGIAPPRTSFPTSKGDVRQSLTPSGARPRQASMRPAPSGSTPAKAPSMPAPRAPSMRPPSMRPPPVQAVPTPGHGVATPIAEYDDAATTLHQSQLDALPPPVGAPMPAEDAAAQRRISTERLPAAGGRSKLPMIAVGVLLLLLLGVGSVLAWKMMDSGVTSQPIATVDMPTGPTGGGGVQAPPVPPPQGVQGHAVVPDNTGGAGEGGGGGEPTPPTQAGGGEPHDVVDTGDPAGAGAEPHHGSGKNHKKQHDDDTPRPPRPGATGFVQVVTPGGWANIFDSHGRPLGQSPTRIELPAGHTSISLRPFGQPPNIRVDVDVEAGHTVRVSRAVEGG